jgi:hypothetical protein
VEAGASKKEQEQGVLTHEPNTECTHSVLAEMETRSSGCGRWGGCCS